jgi:hypothetical protein
MYVQLSAGVVDRLSLSPHGDVVAGHGTFGDVTTLRSCLVRLPNGQVSGQSRTSP